MDSTGRGTKQGLINAINYAQKLNIPILNYSGNTDEQYNGLKSAIMAYKGLFVAAAGNDDNNNDNTHIYPASYSLDNIISVGASDLNNKRSDWGNFGNLWGLLAGQKSNYGKTTVDIFAPGTDILSTYPLSLCSNSGGACTKSGHIDYGYHSMSGTSMAAPMVTGVAALLLSHNPDLTTAELKSAILENAFPVDSLKECCSTGGVLDAHAAIMSVFGYVVSNIPSGVEIIGANNVDKAHGILDIPMEIIGEGVVTSIGSSAFKNQTQIRKVIMPNTVTSIEDDAFAGCTDLMSVYLPANVTHIGERAYAMCNNLNISVSSSNPNYTAEGNILYNKNKTKIISAGNVSSEIMIPDSVVQIGAYAFENNDKIQFVHFNKNVLIGTHAFARCEFLTAAYFYSTDLPNLGVSSFDNTNFTVYTPLVSQSAYEKAFAPYTEKVDSILVHIDFESDGSTLYERDVYYGSLLSDLPTPTKAGYELLGWNESELFDGSQYENGDLWFNKTDSTLYAEWSPKQYYIDFNGFASDGLSNKVVTYNAAVGTLPTVTRNGYTFLGWKTQYGQYYDANTIWTEPNNMVLTSDWAANTYTITYNGNGGTESVSTQQVVYDTTVNELATAERVGYEFVGWNTAADGSGQMYSAPLVSSFDSDITLYAQWEPIDYSITYNLDGGVLTQANRSTYTILSDDIILNNPTKTGYTFVAWYEGNDIVDVVSSGSCGDRYFTARWAANQYTVTLDSNGGSLDGDNSFLVEYGALFTVTVNPFKDGYTFDGWYDSENVKYTTDSGECVMRWDKACNATLYAHWSIKSYEIQINNNGSITWLSANGLSDEQCSIEYGTVLSSINLIAAYKQSSQGYKEGKVFDHFEYDGLNLSWTSVPDLGENGAVITIIPVWVLEEHTIYFNTLCNITFNPIVADFDTDIVFPSINRKGYVFNGW